MAVFSALFSILLFISLLTSTAATTVGVTLDHHPTTPTSSPEQLAAALLRQKITSVRLVEPDPNLIRAFTYSSISLLLTIPNNLIPSLGFNQSNAATWLYTHVVPFYPRANITAISVGTYVTSDIYDVADYLLPAISNLHIALRQLGIRRISVSTTFSLLSTITTVFPPSAAEFQDPLNDVVIRPLLDFLEEANSFFLISLHPYHIYRDISHEIPLGFALFQETPFNYRDDPTTGVRYRNLFDVMVDAVLAAMAVAGHENIPVIVTETGWPSSVGPAAAIGEESDANPVFAEMYLRGLVKHLKSGKGTPLKKEGASEVYVFELFDREVNKSQGSSSTSSLSSSLGMAQWGILYPNLTSKYKIDFSGSIETCSGLFLWMLSAICFLILGMF
ncbi:hypothetical protein RND81_10G138000 [Saponaria officinalis]|uniref:Glucan endo-1,3-beta-D-glucosidase n=1 Tax=Saponaria officinalis TaxID=3572 RepID=A0AAW1I1Q5_SAPOF